jgi:hypothetical protein
VFDHFASRSMVPFALKPGRGTVTATFARRCAFCGESQGRLDVQVVPLPVDFDADEQWRLDDVYEQTAALHVCGER